MEKLKTKIQNKNGITLIALIITIIVLLILAGITIALITSNESAPNKAVEARTENDIGAAKDAATLKAVGYIQEYMDKKYVQNTTFEEGIDTAGDYVASQIHNKTEGNYKFIVDGDTLKVYDKDANTTSAEPIVTGTILDNGNISWGTITPTEPEEPETPVEPLEIGADVDYTTSLNSVTLDDWKVFLSDEDYTYLIYGDYLPTSAINTLSLSNINKMDYGVYAENNRLELINALSTKTNWDDLLSGTLNKDEENEKSINISRSEYVWAMGTPSIDLWVTSWNTNEGYTTLYTAESSSAMDDGLNGYYIGTSQNPNYDSFDVSSENGYNNTLYFPHQESLGSSYGYWLTSPLYWDDHVMGIYSTGGVGSDGYYDDGVCYTYNAIRPVICLPTSELN